jgi:hypothetical protein
MASTRITAARLVLFGALLAAPAASGAQTVGVGPPAAARRRAVRDTALVNALTNFRVLGEREFLEEAGLRVRVVAVPGAAGSARDGESDRPVHWLYVSVSEYGAFPKRRLYRVGPFFAPRLDSLTLDGRVPVAYVTYGVAPDRHQARLEAGLDRIRVSDARGGS